MKRASNYIVIAILYTLIIVSAAECATRVIRLRSRDADEICETLRQIFGDRMRFAPVPSMNAVVIGADTDDDLNEAAMLLAGLDRRQATFRFSVRRREGASGTERGFRISGRRGGVRYETTSRRTSGSQSRTVTGMEGAWLALAEDMMRIETLHTPWGPEPAVIRHHQGIEIRGTVGSASGTAIVDVRAAAGPETRTSSILSRIEAPLGTWVALGGTSGSTSDSGAGTSAGRTVSYGKQDGSGTSLDEWEIRVDLVDPGD